MTEFKQSLRDGELKMGLFMNSNSTTVSEQLAHLGYDWVLVDGQHAPLSSKKLSTILCSIQSGGAKSLVRVASPNDRAGVQQALDLGADGVLIPYVNNAEEVRNAVSFCKYPPAGTRSVYFPQRSTNKEGLLGYVGKSNQNVIVAIQIETADSIKNIESIAAVEGVDILFLGQNDLCMSMGLYETYEFPKMYFSPELQGATDALVNAAKKNNKILGLFLFGTDRVGEFIRKGFTFISIGNDLHHILTQAQAHMNTLNSIFPVSMNDIPPVVATTEQTPTKPAKITQKENNNEEEEVPLLPPLPKPMTNNNKNNNGEDSTHIVLAGAALVVLIGLGISVWRNRVIAPH